jgi:hypothetical protein
VQGGADGKVDYNKLSEQVTTAAAAAAPRGTQHQAEMLPEQQIRDLQWLWGCESSQQQKRRLRAKCRSSPHYERPMEQLHMNLYTVPAVNQQ